MAISTIKKHIEILSKIYTFLHQKDYIKKAFIGLIPNKNCLINNIFYPTSIPTNFKGENELISVTVIKKHKYSDEDLILKVKEELEKILYNQRFNLFKNFSY